MIPADEPAGTLDPAALPAARLDPAALPAAAARLDPAALPAAAARLDPAALPALARAAAWWTRMLRSAAGQAATWRCARAWLERWAADDRAAREMSATLDRLVSAAELRRRASLVIRCDDCDGRIVAHATYIQSRPLLWTAQRGMPGVRSWLDGEFWGDVAWCRCREWILPANVLLDALPAPGEAKRELRVSH